MTFEEIYVEHHKLVFNLVLQYVQHTEDAEEITQDVFVKVYENLPGFKGKSSLKTWIYRIAINQSLDFIKSRRSQKRTILAKVFSLDELPVKLEPSAFSHPGIDLEQKEACEEIFKAINQLSDKQKTAVILMKIDHKSQLEAAEIMEINVKALESLFQRAKNNLEKLLKA